MSKKAIIVGEDTPATSVKTKKVSKTKKEKKEFHSIEEMLKDEKFQSILTQKLAVVRKQYELASEKAMDQGGRLKRNCARKLLEVNKFNMASFVVAYVHIRNKNCNLSSELRQYIQAFVLASLQETLKFYEDEFK